VFDTTFGGAGTNTYPLAAAGWTGLGKPAGAKGFKYKGAGSLADPCKVVIVKTTVIKAVCAGAGVTLTPPFTSNAGVVLTLGTSSTKRYCATLGGTPVKNDAKLFKHKDAPAPGSCPTIPSTPAVCGDGTISGNEQCDDSNTNDGDGCNHLCESEVGSCTPLDSFHPHRIVHVSLTTPETLTGLRVDLSYPPFTSSIPGFGDSSVVHSHVTVFPSGGSFVLNDHQDNTGFTASFGNLTPFIPAGPLMDINFDQCIALGRNVCNRNLNVIDCTEGGNPPVCGNGHFPNVTPPPPFVVGSDIGPCDNVAGACPSENACVTQTNVTTCAVTDPVDENGQPVTGVSCSVTIEEASPSGAFLESDSELL
jgi:cysteine-rich repeat protein